MSGSVALFMRILSQSASESSLLNWSAENLEKSLIFGCVPCIFISCRFDYAKLREVVANVGDDVTAEKNFIRVVYKDIIN